MAFWLSNKPRPLGSPGLSCHGGACKGRGARFGPCLAIVGLTIVGNGGPLWAQSIAPQDRAEIVRLRVARGGDADDVSVLIEQANKAGERGLPQDPIVNKIKEGLAKGVDPKRIEPVVRDLVSRLEYARDLVRQLGEGGLVELSPSNRARAVEAFGDALSRGVSPEEAKELGRLAQGGKQKPTPEILASGAKGFALLKEAGVASNDALSLVGEAVRQGYRSGEVLDLAREMKRRGADIQDGRVSVQAVKEAVSRGEQFDRLFRGELRGGGKDSGAGVGREDLRIDSGTRSGERIERPERPIRPERADRIERPHSR